MHDHELNAKELKTLAESAPEFDANGFYGFYSPNHPETFEHSLYFGRTNDERKMLAYYRRPMTEAPKCGAFFTNDMADCDPSMGSHHCAKDDTPVLGFLAQELNPMDVR